MRKSAFCICENKGTDQLYTIPLLNKSEISRLSPSSVVVQPVLGQPRSEQVGSYYKGADQSAHLPHYCSLAGCQLVYPPNFRHLCTVDA